MTQSYSPQQVLLRLTQAGVAFIVIGDIADAAHGSSQVTFDLDICYERSRENLEKLAQALQEMHATLRSAPPDVPFLLDARTLAAGDHFTFSTDYGDLDCLGTPSGTTGYEDLRRNAIEVEVDGVATAYCLPLLRVPGLWRWRYGQPTGPRQIVLFVPASDLWSGGVAKTAGLVRGHIRRRDAGDPHCRVEDEDKRRHCRIHPPRKEYVAAGREVTDLWLVAWL